MNTGLPSKILAFHHKYWPSITNTDLPRQTLGNGIPQTLVFCHKHLKMWYPNPGLLLQTFGNVISKLWPSVTNIWKCDTQTLACYKYLEMWYQNTGILLQTFGNVVLRHWSPFTNNWKCDNQTLASFINIWKCETQTLASCHKHLEIVGHRITVLARRLFLKCSRRFSEGRT